MTANCGAGVPGSTPQSGGTPQPNARGTLKQNHARRGPLRRRVRAAHYRSDSRCHRTRQATSRRIHVTNTRSDTGRSRFHSVGFGAGVQFVPPDGARLASRSKRIGVSFSATTGLTFDSLVSPPLCNPVTITRSCISHRQKTLRSRRADQMRAAKPICFPMTKITVPGR